jgi:hypothetical protein
MSVYDRARKKQLPDQAKGSHSSWRTYGVLGDADAADSGRKRPAEASTVEELSHDALLDCASLPQFDHQRALPKPAAVAALEVSSPDKEVDVKHPDSADKVLQRVLRESAASHAADQAQRATARERLQRVVESFKGKVRPVKADGNCQFRAISLQLYGDESHHAAIRSQVVKQLASVPQHYMGFVHGEKFADYSRRMSQDGQWGDNVTLQAASDVLGMRISILTDQPGSEHVSIHPSQMLNATTRTSLCLAFVAEFHYDAVDLS